MMKFGNTISAFAVLQGRRKTSSNNKEESKSEASKSSTPPRPAPAVSKPNSAKKVSKVNGFTKKKKACTKKAKHINKNAAKKFKIQALRDLETLEEIASPVTFDKSKKMNPASSTPAPILNANSETLSQETTALDTLVTSKVSPFMFDSLAEAKNCFEWLIGPVKPGKFFSELWEKKPLLVKRHQPNYYKGIFSCKELDRILQEKHLQFTKNVDVTTYMNGKRETHNPDGRAYAAVVWDYFQNGCSVRLLNPQTYSKSVWKLASILQEYFGSFVGANVYLTPAGSQGFAPHYDDIEAFVIQLEGRKTWKLYSPRSPSEELPRFSSGNFTSEEIGEPILTAELNPGDLLYFPRGIIHQAFAPDDTHSLHITLSTCQKHTWGDLMEHIVTRSLQLAMDNDVEFRQSLPRDYLCYMGVANSDVEHPSRDAFLQKTQKLFEKLVGYFPVDSAVDQVAKKFIHDSLPPYLMEADRACSIHGNGERWERGQVVNRTELDPDTPVKLIRYGAVRLVMEEDSVRLYHTLENSREYHEYEPQYVEVGADLAPGVEFLLHAYPNYKTIEELPLATQEMKMELANLLYDKGLLLTEEPLEPVE